jgi:hypothetical protein
VYSFFNLDTRCGGWSTPRLSLFIPRNDPVSFYRWLGGPQGPSERVQKISPKRGFDPRTVQPAARRYALCMSCGAPEFWALRSCGADLTQGQLHRKDKNKNSVILMEVRLQTESEGNGILGGKKP